MGRYIYPAIFTLENNTYNVAVPDLPGCFTCGDTLVDAIDMARDAISMWLCDAEDKKESIPKPSEFSTFECPPQGFINLIDADTLEYRRENDNRAVKKTLSVPSWLNAKAEKVGVNFSQLLQSALINHLGIENSDYLEKAINRAKSQTKTIRTTLEKLEKIGKNKNSEIVIQNTNETIRDKDIHEQ